jgi:hypothetical protein
VREVESRRFQLNPGQFLTRDGKFNRGVIRNHPEVARDVPGVFKTKEDHLVRTHTRSGHWNRSQLARAGFLN